MRKFDLLNFAREAAAGAPDMVRRRLLTAAAASLALPGALACDAEVWLLFAGVPGCGGGTIAL